MEAWNPLLTVLWLNNSSCSSLGVSEYEATEPISLFYGSRWWHTWRKLIYNILKVPERSRKCPRMTIRSAKNDWNLIFDALIHWSKMERRQSRLSSRKGQRRRRSNTMQQRSKMTDQSDCGEQRCPTKIHEIWTIHSCRPTEQMVLQWQSASKERTVWVCSVKEWSCSFLLLLPVNQTGWTREADTCSSEALLCAFLCTAVGAYSAWAVIPKGTSTSYLSASAARSPLNYVLFLLLSWNFPQCGMNKGFSYLDERQWPNSFRFQPQVHIF